MEREKGESMKNVIYTIAFISVALNIGLATKYVTIGKQDMCVPTMSLGEIE